MGIVAAVIVFSVLVFFHELGHFVFAKFSGVYVERFSIGFGPVVLSKTWGETEYALSLIPLGGYVKMYGENPSEVDENDDNRLKGRSFNEQSLKARTAIISAGPIFNFILAALLFTVVYLIGVPRLLPIAGAIQEDMPANVFLQKGDVILSINDTKIEFWDEMSTIIRNHAGEKLLFKIKRDEQILDVNIIPKISITKNIFGEDVKVGLIGIQPDGTTINVVYNPAKAISLGLKKTYEVTKLTLVGIVKLVSRVIPADNIGGPILIFQMARDTAKAGLNSLLMFTAIISINLAILNLLPIPILDGGHLFFNLIEAITRKPVNLRMREVGQMIGLALILALTFFAFYNDIVRIIKG